MATHLATRSGVYADSVTLMQVSQAVAGTEGVEAALVAMGTPVNLELLPGMGFDTDELDAGPNDLVVAIRASDEDALAAGLDAVDASLAGGGGGTRGFGAPPAPRTTADAIDEDTTLVLVSTPGEHAVAEARDALAAGVDVMVFSDHVSVDDEVALKDVAAEAGLLVMGPDAGTAIVGGVGLGFANVVSPGPVGIVAASGTGAQQLTCLLDDAGIGISHVLGVGGRDLSAAVGGRATLAALALLDEDPATELVVVLSKPPAPDVAEAVTTAADAAATPVRTALLGPGRDDLTTVAEGIATALDRPWPAPTSWPADPPPRRRPGRLVGLFAGGTLATEAVLLAAEVLADPVHANVATDVAAPLDGAVTADGHLVVDLGEDDYTAGRPHPMIDQSLRLERIAAEAPDAAVLLLDVVLGHGAHPDPAGELAPALTSALDANPGLAVVVSLCGTAGDPQDREAQAAALHAAGASVHLSNAEAVRTAAGLIEA
ncbi:FdrA family protein [Salsipaludibacter albus]|uniref:FdrA family protein n=1 Tax=Salsipaludibacter albus TaxID=2849650 RepID=UPI001EE442FF|nr:FdrA family protein [Salsipaludibacter albus]MBY5163014.1 FdrA family protein [Salsipaludibacter albus]